jgi:hypothetical protein
MTLFEHPIWPRLRPYAHVTEGRKNLDFLGVPEALRAEALAVLVSCVACGAQIHPLRLRAKSQRSRIARTAVEKRLFYAATCAQDEMPGCSRTKLAKRHKRDVLTELGAEDSDDTAFAVRVLRAYADADPANGHRVLTAIPVLERRLRS